MKEGTTHGGLVAFDPGLAPSSGTGWARFHYGELFSAGVLVPVKGTLEDKLRELARQAHTATNSTDTVVMEHMRIYPGPRQKGDQNDLIDLAVLEGMILGATNPAGIVLVSARTWKGNVPKDIMGKRILAALSEAERAQIEGKGKRMHNALDAIGIGLWALGRLR